MNYIHLKYIEENGIDITTLSDALQNKLASFTKGREAAESAVNPDQKAKSIERMELQSKDLLEQIEAEEADADEAIAIARQKEIDDEAAKNKPAKKESSGSGWFWAALLTIGAIIVGKELLNGKNKK